MRTLNMYTGSWADGVVLKHWDQGNPYYIQLVDGDKASVFKTVFKTVFKSSLGSGVYIVTGTWG